MVAPEQPQLHGLDVPDPPIRQLGSHVVGLPERPRQPRALNVRQLSRWAERQIGAIVGITGVGRGTDVFVLSQAVKLGEEVGELHAEILGRLKMQRSDKSHLFDSAGLAGELADVIMSAAVLAQALNIDLDRAVKGKMEVIEARMAARSAQNSAS